MKKYSLTSGFLALLAMAGLLTGCVASAVAPTSSVDATPTTSSASSAGSQDVVGVTGDNARAASHGKDTDPNYALVFPQESVNRIDITLTPEAWAALQAEMTDQFGEAGQRQVGGGPGPMPGGQNAGGNQPPQGQPPADGAQPPQANADSANRPGNGGMPALNFGDTSYVASTITFNGETWEEVGFRYSGNSTLQSSWQNGTKKISFRLDFDEYEDQDPATADQRFYGFKQLAFKSNAMDSSYLREKVVADIFREAGVAASQTAFYEVYVDYGEGSQYFGLYTAAEVVDDTVIETQFSDDSGNVYKPEGSGAAFVEGTFNTESFEKQTNQQAADWSDIEAVFTTLNSDLRTSDPAAWRANLEAVFDVQAFLRWLAVDTVVQNWDTYGAMAHNYYLYTDPADGLVTWIPWDNNMALSASAAGPEGDAPRGNRAGGNGGPGRSVRELDLSAVTDQWPLIRFLMDDPVYQAQYQQYLSETIDGAFQPEKLAATYQKYHDLIAPYVQKETQGYTQLASIDSFNQSVAGLTQHAQARYDAVIAYLASR